MTRLVVAGAKFGISFLLGVIVFFLNIRGVSVAKFAQDYKCFQLSQCAHGSERGPMGQPSLNCKS